ncbi:MAG: YCF48-related protein [Pirellulaceae bacterium]
MSRFIVVFSFACWLLSWATAISVARAQPAASPPTALADAELAAITFVDADRGWAVGDRGAIWHSVDGGRNWSLQNSGVTCRLEAVQFLDANNGWIVGGWTQPYTHESHGAVLRTRDGGRTWQSASGLLLPGLKQIRMIDAKNGWALGETSALFPSGVFRTDDGGRGWAPVPKGDTLGWVTGDFRSPTSGAVAGLGGATCLVTPSEVRPSRTQNLGPRYLRRMQLVGESGGWLVGDGGLVLTTLDGAVNWIPPSGSLPESAATELDFRALAVLGQRVWIAGAPGTCVLHSADGGQTWETQKTEQTVPIRGLFFLDEYRGWASGSLGTILHTRDGGRTWRVQKSGGSRVALLGIFSQPDHVPLEVVALQSASEAFLAACEIVGRPSRDQVSTAAEFTVLQRTHAALIAAGGSAADTAWRFPLAEPGVPQSGESILNRWNLANDGQATARLEEHLVRRIRQWRPEVILTEDVSPRGDDPLAHLVNQVALAAVQKAADSDAYPAQIAAAGLTAWKVKKLFAVQVGDRQGVVNLTPSQWVPRLGRSLADVAELGRGLLTSELALPPRNIGLSLLVDHLPQSTGRRDVMSGISLSPAGEARRALASVPAGDLDQLSRLAQRRHNVQQLLARIESGDANTASWMGQINELTNGLPDQYSGEILWQLAQRHHLTGNSDSAADALHQLRERYPRHPLADSAAIWLMHCYASSEVAWQQRRRTEYSVQLVAATSQQDFVAAPRTTIGVALKQPQATVRQESSASLRMTPVERAGRALALAKEIERTRPTLYANPALRFPLAAAARQAGGSPQTDRLLSPWSTPHSANPWSRCAAAEEWLAAQGKPPPYPIVPAVTALSKPRLDGRLDDPLWQVAKPVTLAGVSVAGEELPSGAMLAFDEEFLYLAATCKKVAGIEYAPADKTRVYDADLAAADRLTFCFDVDRDYATWWQLSIDARGRPAESCFGNLGWNPRWFIATGGDDEWWTIEAAIPLAELAAQPPKVRDAWLVQIQRVVPQNGLQSLRQPAGVIPRPEGFGLLVFE